MFKDRLRKLRKSKGLSQYTLAEQLGLSRGQIGNYEQGSREPDYETLIKIADYFNVSVDYILGRTTELNPISTNPRWLDKFSKIIKSQRGQASTEFMPLLIMQMAALYAISKGILLPDALSSVPLPQLTEEEKNHLVNEIDNAVGDSDVEDEASSLAKEIESLPPRERQAMEAMLDVLKHRNNDEAAAQES